MPAFVGRKEPLNRLAAAYQAVAAPPKSAISGWVGLVLVIGEAGIGKTALLTRFADQIAADVGTVLWGSCWNGDQAPAWWPWTQALRSLLDQRIDLREAVRPELAAIVPDLTTDSSPVRSDPADRVRVLDSAAQLLHRAAVDRPVVVFLDDLQWADPSTMDLLRFVSHQPRSGALLLVGAYRPEELPPNIAGIFGDPASAAELVPLQGLSGDEVADLVRAVTGAAARDDWATVVHERSGGHPFFARELCQLLATGGNPTDVPAAVRDVIGRRLARLSPGCATLLDVAAVAGGTLLPDVLAEVTRLDTTQVAALTEEAVAARILTSTRDPDHGTRFVHDLYRETLYAGLAPARRLELHHRVATALLGRHERGSPVFAAELAYHFTAAIPATDTAAAVLWAQSAARADAVRFAFVEAAGHLTRLRSAVARGGESLPEAVLIGLLTDEAELRLRGGDAVQARALLETAWTRATAAGQAELLGAVALGLDRLDSRFAMPRGDLIEVLSSTRDALKGTGTALEAKVTAALARQLQHSVPADRPRAGSLADEAVRIARVLDDPATLASCLLAQHDTRWTPGTASARAEIAAAIGDLARQVNDPERQAQALLLSATAQLENGSPAFRATFAEYAYFSERLRQPRHNYLLRTRQAALALLDGDIDAGERLSAEAAVLGEAVGDTDVGNVRMSQRLEVVRARNQPAELREMAADAVRWWIGAHAHAHAVAAGFTPALATWTLRGASSTLCSHLTTGARTARTCGRSLSARWPPPRSRCATTSCASAFSMTCFPWLTRARSTARWSATWARTPTVSGSCTQHSTRPKRPASDWSRLSKSTASSALARGRPKPGAHSGILGVTRPSRTAIPQGCNVSATCGRPAIGDTRRFFATPRVCMTSPRCSPIRGPRYPPSPSPAAGLPISHTPEQPNRYSTTPRSSPTGGALLNWTTTLRWLINTPI